MIICLRALSRTPPRNCWYIKDQKHAPRSSALNGKLPKREGDEATTQVEEVKEEDIIGTPIDIIGAFGLV